MTKKRRAFIISFSDLSRDPRIYRQLCALQNSYEISAAGLHRPPDQLATGEFYDLNYKASPAWLRLALAIALKLGFYDWAYWHLGKIRTASKKLENVINVNYDLIIANDIETLPLAVRIKGKARLFIDAHEYAPEEHYHSKVWRFFYHKFLMYLCNTYLKEADRVFTVGPEIAKKYSTSFNVPVEVIMNCPFYEELTPTAVDANDVKIIHHGGAIRSRRLELMIEAMEHTSTRFSLDFMLIPSDPTYLDELKQKASSNPRIRFIPPVPMPEIARFCNNYDIGLYPLRPCNYNECYALPNKFFEFIQARLAIVVGPSPEMASLVEKYALGKVAESFEATDIAKALDSMTISSIYQFKINSHNAAADLSAERQLKALLF